MKDTRVPARQSERVEARAVRPRPVRVGASRRALFKRRHNRRVPITRPSPGVWLLTALHSLLRRLVILGKVAALLLFLAGAAYAGNRAVRHVIASPRFAVRDVRVGATTHVRREEVLALAAVNLGDRLLSIDTDAVAAKVAAHPWIASARVRRELPAVLAIEVVEREAVASALLGNLYLLDASGRPFKRATMEEAEGLVVVTGVSREQYASSRAASEAAFREALSVVNAYRAQDALATRLGPAENTRPPLSEVHIDPRFGFSLMLFEGGGEIRLGRGSYDQKLARLDEIFSALGPHKSLVRAVHLDEPARDRVPVRLAAATPAGAAGTGAGGGKGASSAKGVPAGASSAVSGDSNGVAATPGIKKFRSAPKRGED